MTLEQIPQVDENNSRSYLLGTISIDEDGIWHVHSMGVHSVDGKQYFGNGVESDRNIRKLFAIIGSRMNNNKDHYLKMIDEAKNEPTTEQPADTDPSHG